VETQALSRAGGTNCRLSLGTSSDGTEVWDEDHQVPAAGDQPLCDGEQAGLGGSLQNRGEPLPFPSPLGEGRLFPHSIFCGWRASKANCLSYRCTLGGYRRLPASPPSADRLLVSQGCHTAAALSQLSGRLERKSRCWQNGWFSATRCLLLSPWSKRGRMDLLQSRLLLGVWSVAGGISEDKKLQGFNGSMCERPMDLHCKAKAVLGILFIRF